MTGSGSLTINRRAITVTAAASSKPYDRGISSSGVPTVTSGSLVNGNTGNFTQTYDTKTVGSGKLLTPTGSVNDGNGGNNYTITFAPASTGTITALGLTISGATAVGKVYDGLLTTTMDGAPALVGVISGDSVSLNSASATATFADKHVGPSKPVTVSGYALVAGGDSANYTLAQPTGLSAAISAKPITITAVTNTKVYDGLLTALATPTNSGLASGDSATFSEAYSDKNVGAGNKTLIPSAVITDGNGGANYTVTPINFTTGTITPKPLTITAVTNTKVYDGLTTAAAIPNSTALASGDSAIFSEAYSDKNVGAGNKTLIPSAVITDGNGGLTIPSLPINFTTGTITAKGLTITGLTANAKVYDGTTTATLTGAAALSGVVSLGHCDVSWCAGGKFCRSEHRFPQGRDCHRLLARGRRRA